jgi:hypothetical protein
LRFLIIENSNRQLYAFASFANPSAQKKGAKVLFYGTRTDIELTRNLFVTAALHEQIQHLLVSRRNFDLLKINHDDLPPCWYKTRLANSTAFASYGWGRGQVSSASSKYLGVVALGAGDRGFHVSFRQPVVGCASSKMGATKPIVKTRWCEFGSFRVFGKRTSKSSFLIQCKAVFVAHRLCIQVFSSSLQERFSD